MQTNYTLGNCNWIAHFNKAPYPTNPWAKTKLPKLPDLPPLLILFPSNPLEPLENSEIITNRPCTPSLSHCAYPSGKGVIIRLVEMCCEWDWMDGERYDKNASGVKEKGNSYGNMIQALEVIRSQQALREPSFLWRSVIDGLLLYCYCYRKSLPKALNSLSSPIPIWPHIQIFSSLPS